MQRIANDREDMKNKLQQLNELVELLLVQKGFANAKQIMEKLHQTNNNNPIDQQHQQQQKLETDQHDNDVSISGEGLNNSETKTEAETASHHQCEHQQSHDHSSEVQQINLDGLSNDGNTRETANKIINLLSEIKDRNLRDDFSIDHSLHHCACCSGKLEVV